ncbi:MAG: carboxy terminal-processing peptidase [Bacteroidales bacterium]|nr:carboxy terminal-processing peptidase [Bacteroidales bacterium]
MNIKVLFFSGLFLFSMAGCSAQKIDEQKKQLVLMDLIKRSLEHGHFDPVNIDDDFSKKAMKIYLEQADVFKRFYIQSDIDEFKKFETSLDEQFKSYDFGFFDLSYGILDERTKEAEELCLDILDKPFDLEKDGGKFELDPEKRNWAANKNELRKVWENSLKYEIISRVGDQLDRQDKLTSNKDSTSKIKTIKEIEADSRDKVRKRYKDWFHELRKLDRSDRMADYVNALVSVYDPHTNFFPAKDRQDFDILFSGQLEGIGATLSTRDGYVTIISIVPGGPAWKQGDLEVNDKIVKVGQFEEEPVDITDWRVDKAVQLIRGKKGTLVKLTVQKMDGSQKIIPINRDVVVMEETYAKSAILEDNKSGNKTGYLYLPSFYANFDDPKGRSSSQDVKKELEKLMKENVNGIVLDLRGDGGGSLQDAIEIAGYFIDFGPIVQVKAKDGGARVYGDPDPGVIYSGPLVIMVNSISASASEILAAAMQDYNRALIVGSPQTFGKGTVQRFFNLDELARGYDDIKPLGSLKMTIQKFYRIDGGSTQLNGVKSDIVMADAYAYFDIGERELKFPMEWNKVEAAQYKKFDNEKLFKQLKSRSEQRIASDDAFKLLNENAHRLKENRDRTLISLKLDNYRAEKKRLEEIAKKYERLGKDSLDVRVLPISVDLAEASKDSTKNVLFKKWLGAIRTDNYIYESSRIVNDWSSMGIARKND